MARIDGYGHAVNPDAPVSFRFDGQTVMGLEGDTIASALLANDIRLMGRSFKYHRPRGVFTAGPEEPNALAEIGRGGRQSPNVRMTVQEIFHGLDARSQNRWPSLTWDALEVNDLLSPFLSAGFYYKTFMWPRQFWERVYEPFIRRAAGLGVLSGDFDTLRCDKAFAHCDLLIIGGGPAGLMAALTAAQAGAEVILADETPAFGGRLLSEDEEIDGQPAPLWVKGAVAQLAALPNVRLMTRTTVTGAYDGGTFGALERNSTHRADAHPDAPYETFWRIAARRAILCAGAVERPIAFPNNDRPGVMLAGAVRSYLHRYGVVPGKRIAVFGNSDDARRTARDLTAAGARVVAVIDPRPEAAGTDDLPHFPGAEVVGTRGRLGLEWIIIRRADGSERRIECDCLAVSGGWNPSVHLTCHMGGRPTWSDDLAAFVPTDGAVPGLTVAGAAAGQMSTHAALRGGQAQAVQAVEDLDKTAPDLPLPQAQDAPYALRAHWLVDAPGRAWLDLQNDVTAKDVKQAAAENMTSVEHMKRYTTQGMATDQGKLSNVTALAILADATGRSIPETGTTTFRPPYTPVAFGALGAGAQGKGFQPERLTPSHRINVERDAPTVPAGLWWRPGYFPQAGERTWRDSCDREVQMVRTHVGICDVTTLGKIDVQGPDAAAFLDFVYTGMMSTLKVGRVRYGLMLREDGIVMDDGTCARLAERHFLVTTTTAAAGQVMKHFDFVHQCLRPDLDVRFISVTEQFAQFAIAGPQSRALLEDVVETLPEELAFMACAPVTVGGVGARLFRISFSGEHAYELAIPTRYGDSLFRQLVTRAEALGGGLYGMEALNVMRIEKGFITHAEIDGRVTADDIGMGRMVSTKKDCIGNTMSKRPGLLGPQREQLVGLKPKGAVQQIPAGAHLFEEGAEAINANDLGHVTSTAYSPTLGHTIALGFLKNGRARHGDVLRLVDHLRKIEARVEVCDPVFFDPEGGRLRA